jgi:hypothetical protein
MSKFVQWKYKTNNGIKSAHGVVLSTVGDTATIEIIRDSVRTGTVLQLPRSHLVELKNQQIALSPTADFLVPDVDLRSRYAMAPPTDSQLKIINSYLPNGITRLAAEDTMVVPFVAADNLLSRRLDRWSVDSLESMAQLLPGLPALLDHDWDDTSKEWGRIFAAEVVRSKTASDKILNQAGNREENLKILRKEGYDQVVFQVFAATDSPVVRALRRGHSGKISTGAFRFSDYWCPLCDTSFSDPECPHIPPFPAWGIYPDEEEGVAPYATRMGLYDMGEASIVTVPNMPNAGII